MAIKDEDNKKEYMKLRKKISFNIRKYRKKNI